MKRFVSLLFMFILAIPAVVSAAPQSEIKVGEHSVTILKNLRVTEAASVNYSTVQTCVITRGGFVKVLGFAGDQVFLLYRYGSGTAAHPDHCGEYTEFFETKKNYLEMRNESQREARAIEKLRKQLHEVGNNNKRSDIEE